MRRGFRFITYSILIALLLSAALCAPVSVDASEYYDIRIGDRVISDSSRTVSGECGTASYDPDTRTLTLDGFVCSDGGIYADAPGGLNLHIKGECVIASDFACGIYTTGALSVTADDGASLRVSAADGLGVGGVSRAIHASGAIYLMSGCITAVGGSGADYSAGIFSSTDIVIDGADVIARGGDGDLASAGIYVPANQPDAAPSSGASLTLLSGSLDASAGAAEHSAAVYTEGNTYIRGGDFTAEGGVAIDAYSIDISGYFMPYVTVGADKENSEIWSGGSLLGYSYVSLTRAVSVTVGETVHGEISVDNIYALYGDTVRVIISPEAGYKLVYACATSAEGEEIPVKDGVFIMPDSAVCVSAVFEPLPAAEIFVNDIVAVGNLEYGYGEGEGYLSVKVELSGGVDADGYDVCYQWYDITLGTPRLIAGAVYPIYYLPVGMDIGRYSYYCRVIAQRRDNGLYTEDASDAVSVDVNIRQVDIPDRDARSFVYNGAVQRYEIADSPFYSVSGNEEVRAGEYVVTLSLRDKEKCCWRGKGIDDIKYSFIIERAVAVISLDVSHITIRYGDPLLLPTASSTLGSVVRDKNEADITDVGEYTVKYTVLETNDYIGEEKTLVVRVERAVYDMSDISFCDQTVYYSGSAYSIFIDGALPSGVSVCYVGNGVTEVGEHTVTATFAGSANYESIPDMTAKITVLAAPIIEESDTSDNGDEPDVEEGGGSDTTPPGVEGNADTDGDDGGDGFEGEDDDIGVGENEAPSNDGAYQAIIIIAASVLSVSIALAVIILVIIKRRRDSLWEQYSKKK